MPRLPRSERRTYTPRLDFERPYRESRQPITELLAGIPESLWDTPLADGETPRQKATHISTGEGCTACWTGIQNLKEALA